MDLDLSRKRSSRYRAVALRRSGYSITEIVRELGIAKSTISAWVKKIKLTDTQKQRLAEIDYCRKKGARFRARAFRQAGYSIKEIVKEVGVAKSTVSVWVRDIVLNDTQKRRLVEKKICNGGNREQYKHADGNF